MGPPICLSSSTPIDPGAGLRSPIAAPRWTSPNACASWPTATSLMPSAFGSCWTTCPHIIPARSIRPFRPAKPDGCCVDWSFITCPSTPAGSTWSRSKSACCASSALIVVSPHGSNSNPKSLPGNRNAMPPERASNGCSPPQRRAPKWGMPIRSSPPFPSPGPRSHNPCAAVLAHLVNCMLSVVREGPYLGRPAALFDRVRPFLADKDVRTVNLVYRAITRAVMRYLLLGAADAHGKGLSRHPCHPAHTGYLEKIGNMLSIVDLIEECLFVSIDIHVHHKEVF